MSKGFRFALCSVLFLAVALAMAAGGYALYYLYCQMRVSYYIPLGTNEVTFSYPDSVGTAALDWEGTIRASRVDKEDIPYENVTYWYTDEQGNILSETQTFLKNAMGNHAPATAPVYDTWTCIDIVELKIDRGEGLEKVDMYILPNKFGILSWALEGNSEENPLLFDPMATYGARSYRESNEFVMSREGWELSFYLK